MLTGARSCSQRAEFALAARLKQGRAGSQPYRRPAYTPIQMAEGYYDVCTTRPQ